MFPTHLKLQKQNINSTFNKHDEDVKDSVLGLLACVMSNVQVM